ncbi:MAG: DUF2974 domain-containing protein [Lachnospiraceae bacterium]|nr:DUF2974 domain-containing protein [Lachnospiraceae bacterium]
MTGQISEAETAMILNTYMYTDYEYAEDGMTLGQIVGEMPSHIDTEGTYSPQYTILKEAVKDPETAALQISFQSKDMGYNEGTNAATFTSKDGEHVYVVYRGTADGEWMDNGEGLTVSETAQQAEALRYFDEVAVALSGSGIGRLVVSGHSKGANKAQYVTLASEHSGYIGACYSIDGQGMSERTIEEKKADLGNEEFKKRQDKLYGINGQNDYVSVLGCAVIPAAHILYVRTDAETTDFAAYHDITRMFASCEKDPDGTEKIVYHGRKNPYVFKRGILGDYVDELSKGLMDLEDDKLKGCASGAMQIPEAAFGGMPFGLDGSHAGLKDIRTFMFSGIPLIAGTLSGTGAGASFTRCLLENERFSHTFSEKDSTFIRYGQLREESEKLTEISEKLGDISEGILTESYKLSFYYDSVLIKESHIKLNTSAMLTQKKLIQKKAAILGDIIGMCEEFDSRSRSW